MILNNRNPIVVRRRKGTPDDPFVDITETHTVDPNAKVTLTEIPDRFHKVRVTASLGNWHEIEDGVLGATEYRVDYTNKLVTFHHSHIGKQFTFEYKGTGMEFIPTSMIYTKQIDGEITQTLEDVTEGASVVIEGAVIATNNANSKATLANEKANYAQEKAEYALETAEKVKTNWRPPVANYAAIATTYPSPSIGDTVMTTSDKKVYRYQDGGWIFTQQHTDTLQAELQSQLQTALDEQLLDIDCGSFTDGQYVEDSLVDGGFF